jgi:hypothetical protein
LIREILDKMGYDLLAVGERELNFGYDFYQSMMEGSEMKVLAANITYGPKEKSFGDEYVIMDVAGVKIGFVNVFIHHAGPNKKDVFEAQGYVMKDPVETLRRDLPKVREKSDFVILLAHAPWGKLNELFQEVSGFDFVIAGHDGGVDKVVRDVKGTKMMRPGSRGQYVGVLKLVIDPEGVVKSLDAELRPVKTSLPENPEIAQLIKETTDKYNELRRAKTISEVRERVEKLKGDKYLGDNICRRCHEDIYKIWLDTPHAYAFERLAEKGMERDSDCIGCHTTGHGRPTGYIPPPISSADGAETAHSGAESPDLRSVQCEACHGMGTYHNRASGDFLKVSEAECVKCHNGEHSPEFDFKEYLPHISCSKLVEDSH